MMENEELEKTTIFLIGLTSKMTDPHFAAAIHDANEVLDLQNYVWKLRIAYSNGADLLGSPERLHLILGIAEAVWHQRPQFVRWGLEALERHEAKHRRDLAAGSGAPDGD